MRHNSVPLGALALTCLIAPNSLALAGGGDSGGNCYAVYTDADGRPYEVPTPGNKIYVTGHRNWIDRNHICDSWDPKYGPRPTR